MKSRQNRLNWLGGAALALSCSTSAVAFELGAFGNVDLINTEAGDTSLRVGNLDLYVAESLDEKTRVLVEIEFRSGRGGFEFETQRYWLMREFSRAFSLGAGRFHTPIGFWSREYHHGKLLMPTATRPFILGFESSASSFVPMHMIAVLAEGDIGYGLHYEAAIANSNSMNSADNNPSLEVPNRSDQSNGKSFFGRLSYKALGVPLKPGISVMSNDVLESGPAQGPALVPRGEPLVEQTLVGFDLRYDSGPFDLLAELYRLENDAQPGVGGGGSYTATAYFTQLGYRLNELLTAFYRYESLDYDTQDPYFVDLLGRDPDGTEHRNVYALRYDFSESNAVKLEVSKRPRALDENGMTTVISWEFLIF